MVGKTKNSRMENCFIIRYIKIKLLFYRIIWFYLFIFKAHKKALYFQEVCFEGVKFMVVYDHNLNKKYQFFLLCFFIVFGYIVGYLKYPGYLTHLLLIITFTILVPLLETKVKVVNRK